MNHEPNARAVRRGPAPVGDGGDEGKLRPAPDPFEDIGKVRVNNPDKPGEYVMVDRPQSEAPADDDADVAHNLTEQATQVIDTATAAIVDNIGALILRAERLRHAITDDTAAAKARVRANLNYGARILELSKKLNTELDELEALHRQTLRGQQ